MRIFNARLARRQLDANGWRCKTQAIAKLNELEENAIRYYRNRRAGGRYGYQLTSYWSYELKMAPILLSISVTDT
jgi:hypothetical protein